MKQLWPLALLLFSCDPGSHSSNPGARGDEPASACNPLFSYECTIELEELPSPASPRSPAEPPLACDRDLDCFNIGMICLDSTCAPQCSADPDCDEGMLCIPNIHGWGECQAGGPRVELNAALALPELRIGAEHAQRCFSDIRLELHTEVPVYLTVDGASGRIEDASAGGEWEAHALGDCIAMQMAWWVQFPPLTQARLGFWVTVRAYKEPKPEIVPDPYPFDGPVPPE